MWERHVSTEDVDAWQNILQLHICETESGHIPCSIYNKTSIKRNILTIKHNTNGYNNPLAYTAGCETGWAIDAFAVNSGFESVDGMTCLITFESWRNDLSNGISYI
jgi:hypothetical protein